MISEDYFISRSTNFLDELLVSPEGYSIWHEPKDSQRYIRITGKDGYNQIEFWYDRNEITLKFFFRDENDPGVAFNSGKSRTFKSDEKGLEAALQCVKDNIENLRKWKEQQEETEISPKYILADNDINS